MVDAWFSTAWSYCCEKGTAGLQEKDESRRQRREMQLDDASQQLNVTSCLRMIGFSLFANTSSSCSTVAQQD